MDKNEIINDNNLKNNEDKINSNLSNNNIQWTSHHEKILIDWADKATCYKWLHEKSHIEYSSRNKWFTIPVIIMSTFTGTANFAQDRIPSEYLGIATMAIGSINLIAGIITTIQQFLKISELNESHRVSSISWGKFHRNIKVELSKSPIERKPVTHLINSIKEEFDRLIETSNTIPPHIIKKFKFTFSGGEINYDENGNPVSLTNKQKIFNELSKPEICDSLESISNSVYKGPIINVNDIATSQTAINHKKTQDHQINIIQSFISLFETDKKRLPNIEEIEHNIDDTISTELIQNVLTDIECNNADNIISSTSV